MDRTRCLRGRLAEKVKDSEWRCRGTLAKPVIVTVPHDEHVEQYLEIYHKRGDKNRLVCTLEILSPSNKSPGQKGKKLYRRKQREVLARKVHLVEIDLLRAGNHTTAVALDWAKAKTGDFDYHVCVRRYNRFEEFEVYPILMQQLLPTIAIPLLPADGDVALELQSLFQRAYEAGPYAFARLSRGADRAAADVEAGIVDGRGAQCGHPSKGCFERMLPSTRDVVARMPSRTATPTTPSIGKARRAANS